MNLGFWGPIAERWAVVEKGRKGIEVLEHRHRVAELNELLSNEGGIFGSDLRWPRCAAEE
jgi:hypothetical protein